ncbi:MAG: hypothetical protein ACTSPB_11885 [Candidatus Thorarchaeota archaeon]
MVAPILEGTNSIKVQCYCGEEKEIYFPCPDESLAREQLEWMFRHLRDHKGLYHDTPFDLKVTTMAVNWTIEEGTDLSSPSLPQPQEGQDKE